MTKSTYYGGTYHSLFAVLLLVWPVLALSQTGSAKITDLGTLMELAETNYPTIAAKRAEAEAAKAGAQLEKNTLLPSLDAAYQANYATYNNITGMNYPGQLIPISGPPSDDNYGAVPGSSASLLMKWSPITFGQRSASIEYYQKLYEKNLAGVEDEVLKVKFRVALLYLEMATTQELMKAYERNIERNEFNVEQARVLVEAGLRPGVDILKFKGELSKAKTEVYQLQNHLETQKQQLQELLASQDLTGIVAGSALFGELPIEAPLTVTSDTLMNPTLKMAQMNWQAERARSKQINRSWTPRLEFWGTAYARGSGIDFDGTVNRSGGFDLSRYNYGVGAQLVFPILGLTDVKIKSARQEAIARSAEAYMEQAELALGQEEQVALNDLGTSLKIAHEIPIEYQAAEAAFNALQVRYNEGLIDYTDLIQAQYDLLNTEARLKSVHANTWKALLRLAVIRGDINIFLNQIQH